MKEGVIKVARVAGATAVGLGSAASPVDALIQPRAGIVEASKVPQTTPDGYTISPLAEPTPWGQPTTDRVLEVEPTGPADFPLRPPELEGSLDPNLPHGWFFTQGRGINDPYPKGYILYDKDNIPMYSLFNQYGGKAELGFAITDRYQAPDGKWMQLFEKGIITFDQATGKHELVRGFDFLGSAGINLETTWHKVPNNWHWNEDGYPDLDTRHLPDWDGVGPLTGTKQEFHINKIFRKENFKGITDEQLEALRQAFIGIPNWLHTNGLPLATQTYHDPVRGTIHSIRGQMYAVQWEENPRPGTADKGHEVIKMGGTDMIKGYGLSGERPDLVNPEAARAKDNPYGVGGPENPQQVINRKLQELLAYSTEENGQKYPNALGLNEQEVNGYIAGTRKETDLTSFRLLKNAKGEPLVVLVTGGQYGLKTDRPNIGNIQAAVNRLNQIDPTTLDLLINGFGLKTITGEIAPGITFVRNPSYGTTYKKEGVLLFNEKAQDFPVNSVLARILGESRGIYVRQHLTWNGSRWINTVPDKLDEHEGLDKSMWLKQWIETHKIQLTPDEYSSMTTLANAWVRFYTDVARNEA